MRVEWAPEGGMLQLTTESLEEITSLLGIAYHKYVTAGAVSECSVCVRLGEATPEDALLALLDSLYSGMIALLPTTKEDLQDGSRTDA